MPSKALKIMGATAVLALAASAMSACSPSAPSTGMSEAQLAEQAKKDGLTIEQERDLRRMTGRPDPGYHFEGYSEKRVKATLGTHAFGFPMNLYTNQTGPDFQGGVSLTLRWPAMEPFVPGAKYDAAYGNAYMDESIRFQPTVVDKVPIESVPGRFIQPSPNDHDSPLTHIALRLRGEETYGLTPYYADVPAIARYLGGDGKPASREDAIAAGDDWFLVRDDKGRITTLIRCDSREIKGASLKEGRLEDLPPGESRGICHHLIAIPSLSLAVDITYMRAYLPDWRKIEERVRDVFFEGASHGEAL